MKRIAAALPVVVFLLVAHCSFALAADGGPPAAADLQAKLQALDAAHEAGILSDQEYEGKRAELEAEVQARALAKAVAERLEALQAAHRAGILTDEEFERKEAELKAQLKPGRRPLDEATRERLEALEAAHQAGILSDEEFEQKKAELLGQAPTPPQPAAEKKMKVYRHHIGVTFSHPEDWTVKEHDAFLQLVPPRPGAAAEGPTELYFVLAEEVSKEGLTRPDDARVIEYLDTQVRSVAYTLKRTAKPQAVDMDRGEGMVFNWGGKSPKGDVLRARAFVSIIGDYGVVLLAVGFQGQVEARDADMRRMFATFAFAEPPAPGADSPQAGELARHFVGTWVAVTSNTETRVQLAANGQYSYGYSSSYSGEDWGTAHEDQDRGRWTVRGDREKGALIFTSEDGGQETCEYRVHVEKGQTYWSEYWIDGSLYAKQAE